MAKTESTRDIPRCRSCRRYLQDADSRRRGFGPSCWKRWLASLASLDPSDPRVFQAAVTQPLFPEILK
jgi:hypothetical protein